MMPHPDTQSAVCKLTRELVLKQIARERALRVGLTDSEQAGRAHGWRRLVLSCRAVVPMRLERVPPTAAAGPIGSVVA